jgi:uncharacterized protein (DUF1697 family)
VQTYALLIRGINVGRAKRVAMEDLRALLQEMGYRGVRTLLNSGNAVFDAPRTPGPAALEAALAARTGVSARMTVLSAAELAALAADNPLREVASDPSRLLVAILRDPADRPKLDSLAGLAWAPEVLILGPRAAYMWCPAGVLSSRVADAVGRLLGDGVTTRNWSTLTKLSTLAGAER